MASISAANDTQRAFSLYRTGMSFLDFITRLAVKFNSDKSPSIAPLNVESKDINEVSVHEIMEKSWSNAEKQWITIESPVTYYATMITLIDSLIVPFKKKNKTPLFLGLGSGPGLYEAFLSTLVPKAQLHFIASDYSQGMVDRANRYKDYSRWKNIDFKRIDMQSIPMKNESVDIVFLNNSLQWVQNQDKALSEVSRVLKEGGSAFVVIHLHPMAFQYEDADNPGEYKAQEIPSIDVMSSIEGHNLEVKFMRTIMTTQGQADKNSFRHFIQVRKNSKKFLPWQVKKAQGDFGMSVQGKNVS